MQDTKEKLILIAVLLAIMCAESLANICSPIIGSILNFLFIDHIEIIVLAMIILVIYVVTM